MNAKAPEDDKLRQYASVRLTRAEGLYLDEMRRQGGFATRATMLRSMIQQIIRDDQAAEGQAAK